MKLGSTHREGTRWRATWYDDAGKRHAVTAKTATDAEARRAWATAGARSDQPLGTNLDWWASERLQRQLDNNRLKGVDGRRVPA